MIGLFCKRALQKRLYFAKETYTFKGPTNCSQPIEVERHRTWYLWIRCRRLFESETDVFSKNSQIEKSWVKKELHLAWWWWIQSRRLCRSQTGVLSKIRIRYVQNRAILDVIMVNTVWKARLKAFSKSNGYGICTTYKIKNRITWKERQLVWWMSLRCGRIFRRTIGVLSNNIDGGDGDGEKRVAVCCSVLQCVAVCCSVSQCVAAVQKRNRCVFQQYRWWWWELWEV